MTKNLLILLALSITGVFCFMYCKTAKAAPVPPTPPVVIDDATAKGPMVSMKTHGCRGFCPVFELAFDQNGTMTYTPERNTIVTEPKSIKITKKELETLRAMVKAFPAYKYPDKVESSIADASMVTMNFYSPKGVKSITGTIDRPKQLLDIEDYMRTLAESYGINTRDGKNPNDIPEGQVGEVIVLLTKDINAGNWIRQYEHLQLKLVRRVSAENTWVVAYNTTQITGKGLVALFKRSPDVVECTQNEKVSDRKN